VYKPRPVVRCINCFVLPELTSFDADARPIAQKENTSQYLLHILEVETSISPLDHSTLRGGFWTESAPRVDGVLICYDSSDAKSFLPVESFLRKLSQLLIRIIYHLKCYRRIS